MSKSKKHETDEGRRRLILGLFAGGAVLVVGPAAYSIYSSLSQSTQSAVLTPTKGKPYETITPQTGVIRFEDVKAGKYSPEAYISYLKQTSPAVKEAIQRGGLVDILYNPKDSDLAALLERLFMRGGYSGEELRQVTQASLIDFKQRKDPMYTLGLTYSLYGEGIPVPIIVFPYAFKHPFLNKDEDFRSVVEYHELLHVQFNYSGINLNGAKISSKEYESGDINPEFSLDLEEALAYHSEISHVLRTVDVVPGNFSPGYVGFITENYSTKYSGVLNYAPKTQFEGRVKELALVTLKTIMPRVNGNSIIVNYFIDNRAGNYIINKMQK